MEVKAYLEDEIRLDNGLTSPFSGHVQEGMPCDILAPAHWHEYIEILYCVEGSIQVFVDSSLYICNKGEMTLINSKEVHYVIGHGTEKSKYFVLKIKPEVLFTTPNNAFEIKYILPFVISGANNQKVFSKNDLQNSNIPHFVQNIVHEYECKKYGFELAIHSYACNVFLWILRFWNDKNIDLHLQLNEDTLAKLQSVFEYVDKNYMDIITVEDVAKLCNMSYSYFSRFFKASFKRNFSEYVNYIRISKAEKLLTTSDMNITEIALETGFSTSSYFIQQFKLYKNISPKQYRKNIKKYL